MDPAMRILAEAMLDVLGKETPEAGLLKLGRQMHAHSAESVRPYFEGLSHFEKRACQTRAEQLARCHRP
jgi:hypothetical protein